MITFLNAVARGSAGTLLLSMLTVAAQAQFTPVFEDPFAASTDTFNLNLETAVRQNGSLAPIDYVSVTPDVTDGFQHQLFSVATASTQPLQIAENGSNPPGAAPIFAYMTTVSPDFNFNGTIAGGDIVGKRITFDLDVGVIAEDAGVGTFTKAGITIGGSSTLVNAEDEVAVQNGAPPSSYFGIQFVEDTFNPNTDPFMQAFADGFIIEDEGNSGVVVPHPGGTGLLNVQLDIDDPADGNPWDGVGSTVVDVSVNGTPVYSYEKGNGGWTENYISLFGSRQFAGNTLAAHTFDDLIVYAAPLSGVVDVDLDDDNNVDGNDLLLIQRTDPSLTGAWQAQYGAGLATAVATTVPEPVSASLLLAMLSGGVLTARRRTSWRTAHSA